jgi:hypothetical protein
VETLANQYIVFSDTLQQMQFNTTCTCRACQNMKLLDLKMCVHYGEYLIQKLGDREELLGADVIKIESVQRPDPYRYTLAQPDRDHWYESGSVWNDANCNKRSLTLDLSRPEGKSIFERLVPHADIVISNFSNRVMPNLGLTQERLLELNPNLLAVAMPGYGIGGPWEEYVGYAIAFEQLVTASMTDWVTCVPPGLSRKMVSPLWTDGKWGRIQFGSRDTKDSF